MLLGTAFITVFLAMVASYVIVRHYVIVKPLKHLRDVSDAVSRGNVEQRADIHTADEFEELGVAFNRMLRRLMSAQEELRQASTLRCQAYARRELCFRRPDAAFVEWRRARFARATVRRAEANQSRSCHRRRRPSGTRAGK